MRPLNLDGSDERDTDARRTLVQNSPTLIPIASNTDTLIRMSLRWPGQSGIPFTPRDAAQAQCDSAHRLPSVLPRTRRHAACTASWRMGPCMQCAAAHARARARTWHHAAASKRPRHQDSSPSPRLRAEYPSTASEFLVALAGHFAKSRDIVQPQPSQDDVWRGPCDKKST